MGELLPRPAPIVPSSGLSLWLVAYFALVASFGPHLGFAWTLAGLAAVAWVLRRLGHDSDRYCPQEVVIVLAGTAAGLALGVIPEALRALCALPHRGVWHDAADPPATGAATRRVAACAARPGRLDGPRGRPRLLTARQPRSAPRIG